MNILIVDDERLARDRLRQVLSDLGGDGKIAVVADAANGREALDLLSSLQIDVMLLDISMPGMDGMEVAQHAQKLPHPPAIIFTTAYDHFAVDAFEVNAVDYLLKPIRSDRLEHALARAKAITDAKLAALHKTTGRMRLHLSACERGKIILVPVDEIVYLRAELKYVTARTCSREYLIEEPLIRLEQEFGDKFMRIHRNCLVAREYVAGFERTGAEEKDGSAQWVVLLKGIEEKLPLSRRQQHIVKEFR